MYYDIGNSTKAGFNVVREIEWLGKKRICQMHIKDNPHYLGEGTIDVADVLRAVSRIGWEGFANLETDSPSKSVEADMKRNLAFVRRRSLRSNAVDGTSKLALRPECKRSRGVIS